MTEIEIARVGRDAREFLPRGPQSFERSFYDDDENTRPWLDRQRVAMTVTDDQTLGQLFDHAIAEFGIYEADWGVHRGGLDHGTRRFMALRYDESPVALVDRLWEYVTVVDDAGLAVWNSPSRDVTYGQLRRAAEAGAMKGDPTRIYLNVRLDAAGGGLYHYWQVLLQAWDVAFGVAVVLVTANETHDLYLKVRRRLDGRQVVGRKTQEWLRRSGHADTLTYMLRGEPWRARDLAGVLGCTAGEAEDMLALYGYDRSATDDVWLYVAGDEMLGLPVRDLSACAVIAYRDEVLRRYGDNEQGAPEDELEVLFREIVRQAESGEVGDLRQVPWDRERLFWQPPRSRIRRALRRLLRRWPRTSPRR